MLRMSERDNNSKSSTKKNEKNKKSKSRNNYKCKRRTKRKGKSYREPRSLSRSLKTLNHSERSTCSQEGEGVEAIVTVVIGAATEAEDTAADGENTRSRLSL